MHGSGHAEITKKLIQLAFKRNWHLKYGKFSIDGHQTLLAHAITVMDIGLKLSDYLTTSKKAKIDEKKKSLILISCFLHDALKETDIWQNAVKEKGTEPEDFWQRTPSKLKGVLNEFLKEIEKTGISLSEEEKRIVFDSILCSEQIESPEHESEILKAEPDPDITNIVTLADILGSLKKPAEAKHLSEKGKLILIKYGLKIDYHSVNIIRGITTQLLHKGIADTYLECGYIPVAYFSTGTVYVGLKESVKEITFVRIVENLKKAIKEFFRKHNMNLGKLAFGAINQVIVKIPEYLFFESSESHRSPIESFWDEIMNRYFTESAFKKNPINALLNPFIVLNGVLSTVLDMQEYDESVIQKKLESLLNVNEDLFKDLRRLANTTRSDEKKKIFDRLWVTLPKKSYLELSDNIRKTMIECTKAIQKLGTKRYPIDKFLEDIADNLVFDIEFPSTVEKSIDELTNVYDAYKKGKKRGTPVCVICGKSAKEKAVASLVGEGSETFYNLLGGGLPLGGKQKAWICSLCKSEFTLRKVFQVNFQELLYVFPQISIGDYFSKRWREILSTAVYRWESGGGLLGNYYVWIDTLFKNEIDILSKPLNELLELLGKNPAPKIQKRIETFLKDFYEDPTEIVNILGDQNLAQKLADLYLGKTQISEYAKDESQKQILESFLSVLKHYLHDTGVLKQTEVPVFEAPNFLIIGLKNRIKAYKESEASSKLRKLFICGFLALALQATTKIEESVSIIRESSVTAYGYVEVPTDINLKTLFEKYDIGYIKIRGRKVFGWIGFRDILRVLKILAATISVERTLRSLKGSNPFGRSTLYEILMRPSGQILNVIAQNSEAKFLVSNVNKALPALNILDAEKNVLFR